MKTKSLIIAAILGTAMSAQGATLIFQSDFSSPTATLANTGFSKSAGAATGSWDVNLAGDYLDGLGGGNARSNVYTTDAWVMPSHHYGFELDVTFRTTAAMTRFSFGIIDANYTISGAGDWLNSDLDGGAYGIGYSTAGSESSDFLGVNDDAGIRTVLSQEQVDATVGFAWQTMRITVFGTGFSYSLNGATPSTGTLAAPFDMTRAYRFTAHAQRNSQADFLNITFSATPAPEPSTLGLLGVGGFVLTAARRRKARA